MTFNSVRDIIDAPDWADKAAANMMIPKEGKVYVDTVAKALRLERTHDINIAYSQQNKGNSGSVTAHLIAKDIENQGDLT